MVDDQTNSHPLAQNFAPVERELINGVENEPILSDW